MIHRNLNPITERLVLLTPSELRDALWVLDIIPECGWEDFPNRAIWELKIKEKAERERKG